MIKDLLNIPLGFLVTLIGALPLGLVNLSVVDVAHRKGRKAAIQLAHGAALVEVLFALLAIVFGVALRHLFAESSYVQLFVILVLAIAGLYFLFRSDAAIQQKTLKTNGFLTGLVLNLISFQVLLFWLLAVSVLTAQFNIHFMKVAVVLFLAGVWLGKMAVLWAFVQVSRLILHKSKMVSKNINRVIGLVLFAVAVAQAIKMNL